MIDFTASNLGVDMKDYCHEELNDIIIMFK